MDDRVTGYATENVTPVTPTEVDGLRSLLAHAFIVEPRGPLTDEEIRAFRERDPETPTDLMLRMMTAGDS